MQTGKQIGISFLSLQFCSFIKIIFHEATCAVEFDQGEERSASDPLCGDSAVEQLKITNMFSFKLFFLNIMSKWRNSWAFLIITVP